MSDEYDFFLQTTDEAVYEAALKDSDGDGLSDRLEHSFGTDPNDRDTDDDGLTDGQEVRQGTLVVGGLWNDEHVVWGEVLTDPLSADSDGDGISDPMELALRTDPRATDTDGDGLSDLEETQGRTDPRAADTDGDGLSDGAEVNEVGSDPTRLDTDLDGLSDAEEVNRYGSSALLADTDGDGLSDGAEVVRHGTDPTKTDTDGDGWTDRQETEGLNRDDVARIGVADAPPIGAFTTPSLARDAGVSVTSTAPARPPVTSVNAGVLGSAPLDPVGVTTTGAIGALGDDRMMSEEELAQPGRDAGVLDPDQVMDSVPPEDEMIRPGGGVGVLDPDQVMDSPPPEEEMPRVGGDVGLLDPDEVMDSVPPEDEMIRPGGDLRVLDPDQVIAPHVSITQAAVQPIGLRADILRGGVDGIAMQQGRVPLDADVPFDAPGDPGVDPAAMDALDPAAAAPDPVIEPAPAPSPDAESADLDRDGDGLTDATEAEHGTDPTRRDTDRDGLLDGDELRLGTDPLWADTDGDGLFDGDEVRGIAGHKTDPLRADTDGDWLSDADEIRRYHTDPNRRDTDGDLRTDGHEILNSQSDPNNTWDQRTGEFGGGPNDGPIDSDGDGLPDGWERKNGLHPFNRDTDGDGVLDGEEVDRFGTDPLLVDTDGDGWTDKQETTGMDQSDLPAAGAHAAPPISELSGGLSSGFTAVDPGVSARHTPASVATADVGITLGGLSAADVADDVTVSVLNEEGDLFKDLDRDGLGAREEAALGTNPYHFDTDGDGLDDGDEVYELGTDPLSADTDGDGLDDRSELLRGRDPTVAEADPAADIAAGTEAWSATDDSPTPPAPAEPTPLEPEQMLDDAAGPAPLEPEQVIDDAVIEPAAEPEPIVVDELDPAEIDIIDEGPAPDEIVDLD